VQARLGVQLPADYIAWLQRSNGATGALGESNYVDLWPVEDLIDRNAAYNVAEFAPGLLLFGTDGGDEGFGYDLRTSFAHIVSIPLTGMRWEDAKIQGEKFSEFWQSLKES
jgi:hypothetical protein